MGLSVIALPEPCDQNVLPYFLHPGGNRVLEVTAGLKVILIACTPDLRDWGTLLGPLGTLMSPWLAG